MTLKIMCAAAIAIIMSGECPAYDHYYPIRGYGYSYYGYPGYGHSEREVYRLRQDLRQQQLQESRQLRQKEQELNLLRQQAFSNHQISADQACYYRSTGGFELCEDLFKGDAEQLNGCERLVIERNPSCNGSPPVDIGRNDPRN